MVLLNIVLLTKTVVGFDLIKREKLLSYLSNLLNEIRGHSRKIGPRRSKNRREKSMHKLTECISAFNALSLPNFWVTVDINSDDSEQCIHMGCVGTYKVDSFFLSKVDFCWEYSQNDKPVLTYDRTRKPRKNDQVANRFEKYF